MNDATLEAVTSAAHVAAGRAVQPNDGRYDDYYSEAQMAAWRAVQSYDPSSALTLFEWCRAKAEFACRDFARRLKGRSEGSLARKVRTFTDIEAFFPDGITFDPEDYRTGAEPKSSDYATLAGAVVGRNRMILDAVFLDDRDYRSIGRWLGLSGSTVGLVVGKCLEAVRRRVEMGEAKGVRCRGGHKYALKMCHWCGGKFWKPLHQDQRFCSKTCGRRHRSLTEGTISRPVPCRHCGGEFTPKRNGRVFCSKKCSALNRWSLTCGKPQA